MSSTQQHTDDFEVAQPMHITNSGDPSDDRPGVNEKKPAIEKHITRIPQRDNTETRSPKEDDAEGKTGSNSTHKENLKDKVKKHIPGHHSTGVSSENSAGDNAVQASQSSEFEIAGLMPMTSQGSSDSASGGLPSKPRLERHISSIPDKDDDVEQELGGSGKLRREISHIAQND